ncbi:MAG: RHS repeat-associated core domain-containing protein [Candidatus Acidiferrales bacterium]
MENDPSGLYHAKARYYSPALTRFLSEDPERGKANLFTYAGENAITGSDPSGMDDCGADCDDDSPGANVGNPAAGFIEEIASILNWIFNSNQQSSAATQTIAYSTDVQLRAQSGSSQYSTGTDGNQDVYTPGGGKFLTPDGSTWAQVLDVRFVVPFRRLPEDPNESPGERWVRRGPRGNWYHPPTEHSLHPDNHPPMGPHYDWHQPGESKLRVRQRGLNFQFWSDDLLDWLDFGSELLPLE